jgi:protein-S-isoprenylcysteine O-methyltransferase Ste14
MESIYYWVKVLGSIWLCVILFFFTVGGNRNTKDDKASMLFLMVTLSIVLPVIQYSGGTGDIDLSRGKFSWGFPLVSYFGFLLFFFGMVLRWVGILTLKRQWSVVVAVSDGHKLVDTGIYKFIRHPVYAAVLLELLGFGLAVSNWISILILLIPNAASLSYRIFVEEKALERHFGNDYIEYERRTKRLIPGIF